MNRRIDRIHSWALLAATSAALTGCCCTVHVTEASTGRAAGDERSIRNGNGLDDSVEVMRFGQGSPRFSSTITATDGPVRLFVTSQDPSPTGKGDAHPAFRVHFHPGQLPQDIQVQFQSPGAVVYSAAPPATGWLYFNGVAPIGKTRRVKAVGSGTEFLIEVTATADKIYMIGDYDDYVDVYVHPDTPEEKWCATLHYGESLMVDDAGACSPARTFVGSDLDDFVKTAMKEVAEKPWRR